MYRTRTSLTWRFLSCFFYSLPFENSIEHFPKRESRKSVFIRRAQQGIQTNSRLNDVHDLTRVTIYSTYFPVCRGHTEHIGHDIRYVTASISSSSHALHPRLESFFVAEKCLPSVELPNLTGQCNIFLTVMVNSAPTVLATQALFVAPFETCSRGFRRHGGDLFFEESGLARRKPKASRDQRRPWEQSSCRVRSPLLLVTHEFIRKHFESFLIWNLVIFWS